MHQEALNNKGKEFFPELKKFNDFYLAGGTALALQIGHRMSVDFDFFSDKEIPKNLLDKVKRVFPEKIVFAAVNNPDELTVFVDKVKFTFLRYPFPVLGDFVDYDGIKLLSIKEIAATKAYTIGRRGSFKDYVDLYFLMSKKYISLDEIITMCEKKYKSDFNSRLFLEQLIYLEDIDDVGVVFLEDFLISKEQMQSFFEEEIKKLEM